MPIKSQIREFVKELTLFDDVFFRKVAEDKNFLPGNFADIFERSKIVCGKKFATKGNAKPSRKIFNSRSFMYVR